MVEKLPAWTQKDVAINIGDINEFGAEANSAFVKSDNIESIYYEGSVDRIDKATAYVRSMVYSPVENLEKIRLTNLTKLPEERPKLEIRYEDGSNADKRFVMRKDEQKNNISLQYNEEGILQKIEYKESIEIPAFSTLPYRDVLQYAMTLFSTEQELLFTSNHAQNVFKEKIRNNAESILMKNERYREIVMQFTENMQFLYPQEDFRKEFIAQMEKEILIYIFNEEEIDADNEVILQQTLAKALYRYYNAIADNKTGVAYNALENDESSWHVTVFRGRSRKQTNLYKQDIKQTDRFSYEGRSYCIEQVNAGELSLKIEDLTNQGTITFPVSLDLNSMYTAITADQWEECIQNLPLHINK